MPLQYEAIRDEIMRSGIKKRGAAKKKKVPLKEAKTIAAKIYNSRRKPGQAPVSRWSD